ncbi:MAG: putative colanic acid biosynthesis acetyltransferase [Planctomycetota bacterium]
MNVDARHISAYSLQDKVRRVLWWVVQATLFRWSFHNMYGWRRFVLRRFGATLHATSRVRPTVRIECPWQLTIGANSTVGDRAILYALGEVVLGDRVTVSQGSHLCAGTHDYTHPDQPLVRLGIRIENDAWVAADGFVGPGVVMGEGALLGARGAAFKNLAPWTIYGGNPAKPLKARPRFSDAPTPSAPDAEGLAS